MKAYMISTEAFITNQKGFPVLSKGMQYNLNALFHLNCQVNIYVVCLLFVCCLFVCLFVCLSVCLFVCMLFVCLLNVTFNREFSKEQTK